MAAVPRMIRKEDTLNIMVLTISIAFLIIMVSVLLLWLLTKNLYLDSYFSIEAFFDAQNTAASTELAALAFSMGPEKLIPIMAIVAVANISRVLVVSFIIAAVMDFLGDANVEAVIDDMRARRLSGHVIVCSYNNLSKALITKLKKEKIKYIVLDPDKEKSAELHEMHALSLSEDFTDAETLRRAGISRAKAIVFTNNNDIKNVLGAITARKLNKKILVLSRLENEHVRKKVYALGVTMTFIPEHLAGLEIGDFLVKAA